MEKETKLKFLVDFSFIVVISAIIVFLGKITFEYLIPFVVAFFIAFLVQKPARFISKKIRLSDRLCAAFLAAGIFIIAALIIFFLIYGIVGGMSDLLDNAPNFISYISNAFSSLESKIYSVLNQFSPDLVSDASKVLGEALENTALRFTDWISSFLADIVKSAPSFLFSTLVALVASCYIAKDYEGLKRFFFSMCGNKKSQTLVKIKLIFTQSVLKLLRGYLILFLIMTVLLFFAFLILKIKYPFFVALLIALIDLLPVLGAGTALIPWGLLQIAVGNTAFGFSLLLVYLTVVIARNFLEPKIIGTQIGINPLFTLLAMFLGLKLLGFTGLIIFPVTLIVVIKYYKEQLDEEKQGQN